MRIPYDKWELTFINLPPWLNDEARRILGKTAIELYYSDRESIAFSGTSFGGMLYNRRRIIPFVGISGQYFEGDVISTSGHETELRFLITEATDESSKDETSQKQKYALN